MAYRLKGVDVNAMNLAILKRLKTNSRMSWQQIGKEVHLTGQAVAARVQQMQDEGVIAGFTIRQNQVERHLITVFMEQPNFDAFERFLQLDERVERAYKVTGEGCYQIEFISLSAGDLEPFLNALLSYGKYKVLSAIRCVK